jgi:hypothetical protein
MKDQKDLNFNLKITNIKDPINIIYPPSAIFQTKDLIK